mmetsp:Transcript_30443/g.29836  ORF Transcript_30443/g.29836 Transcript_30443/m.29836 type:complete len:113 (-) Transcript_30443:1827-2165(-)
MLLIWPQVSQLFNIVLNLNGLPLSQNDSWLGLVSFQPLMPHLTSEILSQKRRKVVQVFPVPIIFNGILGILEVIIQKVLGEITQKRQMSIFLFFFLIVKFFKANFFWLLLSC